jgi:hypothetical protein
MTTVTAKNRKEHKISQTLNFTGPEHLFPPRLR